MPSTEKVGDEVAGPIADAGATGAFPPRCALSAAGNVISNGIENDAIVTARSGFGTRVDRRASVTEKGDVSVCDPSSQAQTTGELQIPYL